jgi:biopolymer transport protein ExbB
MGPSVFRSLLRPALAAGGFIWLALPIPVGLPALALAQNGETVAPPTAPLPPVSGVGDLPRDLSPWGMFANADPLVKGVLIGLVFASIVTWTVWLAKTIELMVARGRVRSALKTFASVRSVADAVQKLGKREGTIADFVAAAMAELRLSDETMPPAGIKERVASRLERIEANRGRTMMRGTGVLATIGATAPFVGLFGTVWGIMNSFIGISKSQTTNLAVVAPGIAEALLATAFGLAAAIPAVVIYNVFARQIAAYRALLGDGSAEVLRLIGRDLDRSAATSPASARRPVNLSAAG